MLAPFPYTPSGALLHPKGPASPMPALPVRRCCRPRPAARCLAQHRMSGQPFLPTLLNALHVIHVAATISVPALVQTAPARPVTRRASPPPAPAAPTRAYAPPPPRGPTRVRGLGAGPGRVLVVIHIRQCPLCGCHRTPQQPSSMRFPPSRARAECCPAMPLRQSARPLTKCCPGLADCVCLATTAPAMLLLPTAAAPQTWPPSPRAWPP